MRRAHQRSPQPRQRGSADYLRAPNPPAPVNGYTTQVLEPANGISTRDRTPQILVVGRDLLNSPLDIQVEWRTTQSTALAATYVSEVLGAVSGTQQSVEPPTELSYFTWWYRARSGNKTTDVWGAWTPQYFLSVFPVMGSAEQYVDINIGVENSLVMNATAYLEMNVGSPQAPNDLYPQYLEMNVGLQRLYKVGAEYSEMNVYPQTGAYRQSEYTDFSVVTNGTPVPHIWWIRPEQGKEGYVFNIYGQGFGGFQNEYSGKALLGALASPVVKWEIVPPDTSKAFHISGVAPLTAAAYPGTGAKVILSAADLSIGFGWTIEYEIKVYYTSTGSDQARVEPFFDVAAGFGWAGNVQYSLVDDDVTGLSKFGDQSSYAPYVWKTRKFRFNGTYQFSKFRNFGVEIRGRRYSDSDGPVRAHVRNYVVRDAGGVARLTIIGNDSVVADLTAPETVNYAEIVTMPDVVPGHIEKGVGQDADVVTTEHGWIIATVPNGAISAGVKIVLEDN